MVFKSFEAFFEVKLVNNFLCSINILLLAEPKACCYEQSTIPRFPPLFSGVLLWSPAQWFFVAKAQWGTASEGANSSLLIEKQYVWQKDTLNCVKTVLCVCRPRKWCGIVSDYSWDSLLWNSSCTSLTLIQYWRLVCMNIFLGMLHNFQTPKMCLCWVVSGSWGFSSGGSSFSIARYISAVILVFLSFC